MSEKDLNDPIVLANMGNEIWTVPVGNMVNALENAADRIRELEAALEGKNGQVSRLVNAIKASMNAAGCHPDCAEGDTWARGRHSKACRGLRDALDSIASPPAEMKDEGKS